MWPPWLQDLLKCEVHQRINRDPRTTGNLYLGWTENDVFPHVIERGLADFDAPLGDLTGADRALLYARFNQKGHLDELIHAYRKLFDTTPIAGLPTLLDLGCGPFTAGLALAAAAPDQPFRYVGLDRSVAMRTLGQTLANGALTRGGIAPPTTTVFLDDLRAFDPGPVRGDLSLVVASYLLASPTLDVACLLQDLMVALKRIGPGPAAVLYTNNQWHHDKAGSKYPAFREGLLAAGFTCIVDDHERFTGTPRHRNLAYALYFREPRLDLVLP